MNKRKKKNNHHNITGSGIVAALVCAILLTVMLGGCGGKGAKTEPAAPVAPVTSTEPVTTAEPANPTEPAVTAQPSAPTEPAVPKDPEAPPARQDGERFAAVIILEGMEETVQYEHIRSETLGFEMDYDYERFERRSGSDREQIVSIYDDPEHPENYLELTRRAEDAETVAAAVGEALSQDYDIIREPYTLAHAGECIRIDASNAKGNGGTPDLLQMVYIVAAPDGCRVATAHYGFESAEGFGRRFAYMMNTFSVLGP